MNNYFKICNKILNESLDLEADKRLAATIIDPPTEDHVARLHALADEYNPEIRHLVAQNPNASSETLKKLFYRSATHEPVKSAVMQNPSINKDFAFDILHNYPEHVADLLNNPILHLWHLEDPALFTNNIKQPDLAKKIMDHVPHMAEDNLYNSSLKNISDVVLQHPNNKLNAHRNSK